VTTSVDGLVSGLSTSSLIQQLMQVEKAPQDRLKTKVSTAQTAVASYQSVNSKISAFKSAADDISQLKTWRGVKPTSTSSSVTATATGGLNATAGELTFDITKLARAQSTTMKVDTTKSFDTDNDGTPDAPVRITNAASIDVTPVTYDKDGLVISSGTPVPVDISADQSAEGIAKAINQANLGVRAYVVKVSDTEGVLQLTGTKPGADKGFTIGGLDGTGLGGTDPVTRASQNAVMQVGDPNDGGYTIESGNNTFADVMPGVTITATKEESGVTVSAAADVSGIAAKFQALVDAANATLTEIGAQTAYNAETKKGSPLTGDFTVRQMTQTILSAVSIGLTYPNPKFDANQAEGPGNVKNIEFGSLAQFGIELNRDGKLSFDAGKFTAQYNTDPTKIQEAGIALGDAFEALAGKQSKSVTAVVTGRKNEIDSINNQISDWDVRLSVRQAALQRQYASLETSLGSLKNQSSWLAGQLGGLG
jgi:flagellar hook-associated protein 2